MLGIALPLLQDLVEIESVKEEKELTKKKGSDNSNTDILNEKKCHKLQQQQYKRTYKGR